MTYNEIHDKLTALIASPDTAQAELPAVLDAIKGDYETHVATAEKLAASEDRIRTLQDTNQRLFLAQVGSPTPESEPELEGTAAVDAFVKELMAK